MPFAIAFRDRPHARCTRETPPYGNTKASLAAIRRRARSSSIGQTAANFWAQQGIGFHESALYQLGDNIGTLIY